MTRKIKSPTESELQAVRTMPAPYLVEYTSERYWETRVRVKGERRSKLLAHGMHRHVCIMELSEETLTGPQYVLVRAVSESGAPPENAREAPTCMGVAWSALPEYIASGRIKPL